MGSAREQRGTARRRTDLGRRDDDGPRRPPALPGPYPFDLTLEQGIDGGVGTDLETASNASGSRAGSYANVLEETLVFDWGFRLDEASDLAGFALGETFGRDFDAAPTLLGSRGSFVGGAGETAELIFLQSLTLQGTDLADFTLTGEMQVEYLYSVHPVPEPSTALLLCAGLLGLRAIARPQPGQ